MQASFWATVFAARLPYAPGPGRNSARHGRFEQMDDKTGHGQEGSRERMTSRSPKRFGIDTATNRLQMGRVSLPLPRSRVPRIALGSTLVVGGCLGFLPILGFWMVPVGLVVLSQDIAFVRKRRRRVTIWWGRRQQAKQARAV